MAEDSFTVVAGLMVQSVESLACKHKDLSLIPPTHIEMGHSVSIPEIPGLATGEPVASGTCHRIPGAHWPASFIQSASSQFSEKPCLKKIGGQ